MLAPTDIDDRFGMSYTRHQFDRGTLYGHGGNNSSWHAQIYFVPELQRGFYFLTNTTTGAQWEIDLSCAWKSWILGKPANNICAESLSVVYKISMAAAIIGVLAILLFARAISRVKIGHARLHLLPRTANWVGGVLKYCSIAFTIIIALAAYVVFFTSLIYWRQGVTFLDEIPIYEARYLVIAICGLLIAVLSNIWLTKRSK